MSEQNSDSKNQELLLKYPAQDSLFNFGFITLRDLIDRFKMDVNELFLLHLCYNGIYYGFLQMLSEKWKGIAQTLIRFQYISEDGLITIKGKEIYESLCNRGVIDENTKNIREIMTKDYFEEWWKLYPVSDGFKRGDKKFGISRSLKVYGKKADHRKKLEAIINEGQHTWKDLIEALETEILYRKDESCRSGDNKLKYMHNSLTYIIQRDFEAWIEENKKPKERQGFVNELIDPKNLF